MAEPRVLFVHQNFPGQFRRLAPWLATNGYRVVGLGDIRNIAPRDGPLRVLGYQARQVRTGAHHYLRSFEDAVRRGQDVARACMDLRRQGFEPDIVVGHPAWGEMLFLRDLFPDARIVPYFEYFYRGQGGDAGFDPEFPAMPDARFKLRIRNTAQLHALSECDAGISPTQWQRSTYPVREQQLIRVIHEGIDTTRLRPDRQARFRLRDGRELGPGDQVVTFVSRNLEPYRGFHVFMRALPELQRLLPKAQFVIVGADGVSYGAAPPAPHRSYREMLLAEVGDRIDATRAHFAGRVSYADFVRLMQVSSLHVYLSYPFVLSWSLLEAMACGAPVLASATPPVREMIEDGVSGLLFDFFDRGQLVDKAVQALCGDTGALRAGARARIESGLSFIDASVPAYLRLFRGLLEREQPAE